MAINGHRRLKKSRDLSIESPTWGTWTQFSKVQQFPLGFVFKSPWDFHGLFWGTHWQSWGLIQFCRTPLSKLCISDAHLCIREKHESGRETLMKPYNSKYCQKYLASKLLECTCIPGLELQLPQVKKETYHFQLSWSGKKCYSKSCNRAKNNRQNNPLNLPPSPTKHDNCEWNL